MHFLVLLYYFGESTELLPMTLLNAERWNTPQDGIAIVTAPDRERMGN